MTRHGSLLICAFALIGCGSSDDEDPEPIPIGPTDVVVPDETADALALERLGSWNELPVFTTDRYRQHSSYDRETRPPTTNPLLANGNRDMNNFVCKSADAQMQASLVEPELDLEVCPEDYVHGLVMARAEGPGRMTRFQLTMLSLRNQLADEEMLRFYVDDAREPYIQVPLAAALDGSAGEIFAPPFGRGSPHHLAWYYPVSFEKRLIVAIDRVGPLDLVYYQVDVASNAEHRAAPKQRSEARAAVKSLLAGEVAPQLVDLAPPAAIALAPAQTVPVATLTGPATVHELSVTVARVDLPALEQVRLAVVWDGAGTPAIDVPLSFLFVSGLSEPTESSLALRSTSNGDDVTLSSRLPMPFASSASFSLSSSASAPVSLELSLRGETSVPSVPFGLLHAEIQTTTAPALDTHHPVVDVSGRGRHVGTCLMLEGHGLSSGGVSSPHNFLEGDFRGVIDGALDLRDTGTEDYLDSCFYFESGSFGFAFAHAWDIASDGTQGRVSACRWHVLGDAIDYQASFALDLEIGPGDPTLLDRYRSIGFYYR